MKASTAIEHFGSRQKTCQAAGVAYVTVCKWLERGDRVPIGAALKLQVASRGKLKIDLRLYASDRLTA
jgi:hypothetical protein